jgi:hypothetical protein
VNVQWGITPSCVITGKFNKREGINEEEKRNKIEN